MTDLQDQLNSLALQEAELANAEQNTDTARQRNELLLKIQEILKEVKDDSTAS